MRAMPIGITEEHEELRQAVRRFVDTPHPARGARAALDAERDDRPDVLGRAREPGWLGLHVDEAHGGAGLRLVEQAVVLEELGRACRARAVPPDRARRRGARRTPAVPRPTSGCRKLASRRGDRRGRARAAPSRCSAAMLADVIVCEVDGAWYALDASRT